MARTHVISNQHTSPIALAKSTAIGRKAMTYRNGFMRIGTAASQALSTSTISPITSPYGRASLRLRLLHDIVEVFGSPCGTNPTPSSCPRVGVRRHPLTVFTTRPGGDAMKRSMLVLAIAACAAIASPSTTSARLSDLTETRQAQPNYAQYYYGPYRRHVRRVYRRAYRRAYYGYPYYYGGYYRPYSYGGYYNPYTYGGYYRPYSYGGYYRPY